MSACLVNWSPSASPTTHYCRTHDQYFHERSCPVPAAVARRALDDDATGQDQEALEV